MNGYGFALLMIVPLKFDSSPQSMLGSIAWVLLCSVLMTILYINYFGKYKKPRFLWLLGEYLRIGLMKKNLERAYRAEDTERIKNLLIEASLRKVESSDYHKQKIGLAELYFHSKGADPIIIEMIYNRLIQIFESNHGDMARDEIIKAICYYRHIIDT